MRTHTGFNLLRPTTEDAGTSQIARILRVRSVAVHKLHTARASAFWIFRIGVGGSAVHAVTSVIAAGVLHASA